MTEPLHIIHDRENRVSYGYVITDTDDDSVTLDVAEALLCPQDQFCRKTAKEILEGRLNCQREGIRHVNRDVTISVPMPDDAASWRKLDSLVVSYMNSNYRSPSALVGLYEGRPEE